MTMVSEGVRLFRVAVRTFQRLSPRKHVEEYLRKVYKPRVFPSEEELCAHYLNDLNWNEFKKNLIHTHQLQMSGFVMASIPATLKGSTGWAKWPGYAVLPKIDQSQRPIQEVEAANWPDDPAISSADHWDAYVGDIEETDTVKAVDHKACGEDTHIKQPCRDDNNDIGGVDCMKDETIGDAIFRPKLTNDRSMSQTPAHAKTIVSWRKNMPESPDYKPCKHIFEGSVY